MKNEGADERTLILCEIHKKTTDKIEKTVKI